MDPAGFLEAAVMVATAAAGQLLLSSTDRSDRQQTVAVLRHSCGSVVAAAEKHSGTDAQRSLGSACLRKQQDS